MATNVKSTGEPWIDPDDAPEITEEWIEEADLYHGKTLIRRGRPKVAAPKRQVSIRLDPDIIEKLKASGPGWQTRVNDILRKAVA